MKLPLLKNPSQKKSCLKNRIKKIGLFKVSGQALFSMLLVPFLRRKTRKRKAQLILQYSLSDADFNSKSTHAVSSVNDETCKQLLQQLQPSIVVVNGTRIISKKILQCTNAVFINMHVGITPQYRGSHGGYWALRNNDIANFGTTIHIVDTGVDTGGVLKQAFTVPTAQDNFITYPVIQVAIGIAALKEVLPKIINNT
ncbi:MAG: formyl transferase [Ferruginibacter sp.]